MKFETVEEALAHFETCQKSVMEAQSNLNRLLADYKAQTKEYFGVEDGAQINIVQLTRLIERFGTKTYTAIERLEPASAETFCEHGEL